MVFLKKFIKTNTKKFKQKFLIQNPNIKSIVDFLNKIKIT